jgi:hypothetical protein
MTAAVAPIVMDTVHGSQFSATAHAFHFKLRFSDDHMHIPGEASHAGSWNQGKGAG